MPSDQERLRGYVDTWRSSAEDLLSLLRGLDEQDWSKPSDLPGWDVKAIAAHLAHLESELSGVPQPPVELPDSTRARDLTSAYTEAGVVARADRSPAAIVAELAQAVEVRGRELAASPPTDPSQVPPLTPGGIGWTWETLLRNRVVDMWMHEQDIRRAVGRPGGMTSAGAAHTVAVLSGAFGIVVGKRAAPPAGTTVVLDVTGVSPVHLAVRIDEESGRAVPVLDGPAEPTVTLRMDLETFVVLSGGRRSPGDVHVDVAGDEEIGRRVLSAMAVTP